MVTQGAYVPLDMRHVIITMCHMYRRDFEEIAEVTGITAERARSIYKNCKDVLACASHADIWCEDEDTVKPSQLDAFPFLKLLREIQDQVYKYVLGNNFVHLEYQSDWVEGGSGIDGTRLHKERGLYHYICEAKKSENSVYKNTMDGKDHGLNSSDRHANCYGYSRRGAKRLDLRLLRVSKQMFAEARLMPFTINTFSISTPDVMRKFVMELLPDQIGALRVLHFDVQLTDSLDATRWDYAIRNSGIATHLRKSLWAPPDQLEPSNVRTLQICFRQRFRNMEDYQSFLHDYSGLWSTAFLRFKLCPMDQVTVFLTDEDFGKRTYEWGNIQEDCEVWRIMQKKFRLTVAEKQACCKRLSEELLAHHPVKIISQVWANPGEEGDEVATESEGAQS